MPLPNPETTKNRQRRAHALRVEGKTFAQIGQLVGLTREGARKAIGREERAIADRYREEVSTVRARVASGLFDLLAESRAESARCRREGKNPLRWLELERRVLVDLLRVWPNPEGGGYERTGDGGTTNRLRDDLIVEAHGNRDVARLQRSLDRVLGTSSPEAPASPVVTSAWPDDGRIDQGG